MIRNSLFVFTVFLLSLHATACCADQFAAVDDFDQAVQNELRGFRSTYFRSPSTASALRVDNVFRGAGGRSMRVRASKKQAGFCGLWVHLFDMRSVSPRFFDARSYGFLSFWVKGERGGESFDIKLADQNWIEKQDSVLLGHVDEFVDGGVTKQWQEVLVPLRDRQLDLSRLGGITLDFRSPGDSVIYVDDIGFKSAAHVGSPETLTLNPPVSAARPSPATIWLWNTRELLHDTKRWEELFRFCKIRNVGQIWMQLPYAIVADTAVQLPAAKTAGEPAPRCTISEQTRLRSFLRVAHRQQLKVHALDGAPEYCLKRQHKIPLSVVEAVFDFNQQGQPDERFDGIHFDNEPHLLVSWHCRQRREQILREFLELNAECQRRVRGNSNLEFGVDIPFWWQAQDGAGDCPGNVSFRGVRKAASYHCVDLLDHVGVMNYRDMADGADGMIAHGRDLLEYADGRRGARIFMGVETYRYPDVPVWFCVGLPRVEFDKVVLRNASLAGTSRIGGCRIRVLDDGQSVHLGVELHDSMDDQQRQQAADAVRKLAATFGAAAGRTSRSQTERARLDAKQAIEADPQWQGFQIRDIPTSDPERAHAGFQAVSVMLPKVTFADNSYADFEEQSAAAIDYFRTFSSFGGIAIHYYESYRSLCDN